MKLGTHSFNAQAQAALTSGMPTVLPTNPNNPFAKLVVKSDVGQVVQQWLLLQNKCTLGSASSCALRCQLPGIAPYHALLVMGARQVFIRALAPKLARNGVMVNELLLTEDQTTFEIAGHQFELVRNVRANDPAPTNKPTLNKMKFTLARPMEIGQTRQQPMVPASTSARTAPKQAIELPATFEQPRPVAQSPAIEPFQPRSDSSANAQPQWITDLIQSAMLPLERQLNEIIEPLAAVQNELDKRSKVAGKRRSRPTKRTQTKRSIADQIAPDAFEQEALDTPEHITSELIARETSAAEAAYTTQIDVQPQIARLPEPLIVPVLAPELQSQLAKQSETLDNLNARLTEVKSNLGSLERIVSENFAAVIDASSAPVPTPEPVQEALQRITSVADQMQGLTAQLNDVKSNLGSLQQIVTENLASTNELRSAPQPASQEALERLSDVANQLTALLQDMNARQIAGEHTDAARQEQIRTQEDADLAWREQLRTQIGELKDTVAATESSILSATASTIEKAAQSVTSATEAALLKATELRQQAPKGTCPTSAALLANGHLHATVVAAPQATPAPVAIPSDYGSFHSNVASEFNSAVEIDPQAPEVLSGFESTANDAIEEPASPSNSFAEPEVAQNLFNQFAWNPVTTDDSGFGPAAQEQIAAPEPAPFENPWATPIAYSPATENSAPESPVSNDAISSVPVIESPVQSIDYTNSNGNFIEETIEEVPILEESSSSSLPSWWTEGDKSQFKDDTSASAVLASSWASPSNSTADRSYGQPSETSTSFGNFSEGFDASQETSDYHPASAWNVEVAHETPAAEQVSPPISNDAQAAEAFERPASFTVQQPEPLEDESPAAEESFELSSLLERFGIAREPAVNEVQDTFQDRTPVAKRDSKLLSEELPASQTPFSVQENLGRSQPQEDLVIDQTEIVRAAPESIAPPEPVSTLPASTPPAETGEEESIEDYMKRLMARMRGGSLEEEVKPSSPAPAASAAPSHSPSADSMSSPKIALPGAATERAPTSTTGPFNPEEYVPKALAPEKTRNMAAMRELANNSARSAIQVSARRRYGTAIALKLAIALIGLGVGVTLVMINGLNVNIGLIATIASFLVALIWGFDAFSTIKPLLYAALETRETVPVAEPEEIPQA